MLKIAEYNKITGKKIELSELEKYGFHIGYRGITYDGECNSIPADNVRISNKDKKITIGFNTNIWFDNESYYSNNYIDVLYDLIEAGYVEKVEE